ncbi:DNA/RNA helicase protein [Actinidia rufa]|uniref:DNA/RNA helicase protein n=1 Tax=Actinidia rufa TaxID=165716 RepID=A0A7J0EEB9_9ERIC|nr:DNA/RNA helicase protein [Actinidia rufa]
MELYQDPVNFFMILDRWPQSSIQADDETDESLELLLSQSSETYLLGFVIVNIVGLQHYTGSINGREMVGLVREPLNPHDPNAIKVLNTRTVQVGYIERSAASVLAALIDQNLISVEGIVPNSSRGNRYKIPVQIHIFSHREAFERVKSTISRGGLQLLSNDDASFTLSEAIVVKERKVGREGRSLDEIFKLVDENASKKGALEPLEPPKDVIKSELFVHQKEGLGWLIHRENSGELPPFWEERDGGYLNVLTNYHTKKRPNPLRGGIFADEMGLGKTLTLLSLIAFDKCGVNPSLIDSGGAYNEQFEGIDEGDVKWVVLGNKKGKRGRPIKNDSNSRKKRSTEDTHLDKIAKGKFVGGLERNADVKTTLIVCPPSVFSTWVTQLAEHTIPGRLKVYMYYGERTYEAEELRKYDIVLTTYSTLASEETWSESPIKQIEWWRVILDEAHVIKNVNAQQSRAVTRLETKRRWVVTGTPIQNGSLDLFSLMSFLRFAPFSVKSYWTSLVQRPLAQGNEKGLLRLQVLMATISLRRTKDKGLIGLPPKTIETCFVELSAEERELYDQMENEAKSVVRNYIHADSVARNYSAVLTILLRLRQICTDLALCPSDLKSIFPSTNIEVPLNL